MTARKFAIISGNLVSNVIVADSWNNGVDITDVDPCPGVGWSYLDGVFTPPQVVDAEDTTPYMSHFGFLSRLTPQERTAIRTATSNDYVLDDAMFLFNAAERIDVTLPETQMLVGYLAQQGYIAPERVPELLAPIPLTSPHAKPE